MNGIFMSVCCRHPLHRGVGAIPATDCLRVPVCFLFYAVPSEQTLLSKPYINLAFAVFEFQKSDGGGGQDAETSR